MFERKNKLLFVCGGVIRINIVQHVERGCCSSRRQAVEKVTAAIAEGGLIMGLNSDVPSLNDWCSHLDHQSRQTGGFMFYNVLSRLLVRIRNMCMNRST